MDYWKLNWQEALSIIFAILFSSWVIITSGWYLGWPIVVWVEWLTDGIYGG